MPTIKIDVHNKLARCADKRAFAVCGNSDYVISFNFDSEWDEYKVKTARFIYNGKYQDVVFTGTECAMPALYGVNSVFIGVYAGDIRTTAPAQLLMVRSIMDGKPKHDEPTADVYNQILALMEAGKIKGDKGADGFSPTVSVTETDEGTTVTFTDKDGEKVANIKNGKQGEQGENGASIITITSVLEDAADAPSATRRASKDLLSGTPTVGDKLLSFHKYTSPTTGKKGNWLVLDEVTAVDEYGTATLSLLVYCEIKGNAGANGKDGSDGFSPTATVTQTSTGADISVTDKNGTTNATITNGSDANVTAENIKSALGYTPLESAPVTSVNGKVGAVEIAASDVGAISSADGSVQNAHLADSSVTTDKLAEAERMTSANVINALGYEPEKASGEWELIEEITLTEDTAEIVRTQEPDGTAYNFAACVVTLRVPFKSSGYVSVIFTQGSSSGQPPRIYTRANGDISGRTCYSAASATHSGGHWRIANYEYTPGYSTPNGTWLANLKETVPSFMHLISTENYPVLDCVRVSSNASWTMPAGTIIKIYGIRA